MEYYVGHPLQTRGVEQYVLQGGKGDGMHFLYVRNGKGLELWISLDRCADPTRVVYNGKNMGYLSPCGNVAPAYYEYAGKGFLKAFSAGFCTTVGLEGVGAPCVDEGENVPMHGSICSIPAELNSVLETENGVIISATIRDTVIFGRRLVMKRTYTVSYVENSFTITDTVKNEGETTSPYLIMYHCNMGYPLLTENSIVRIPHTGVRNANDAAKAHADTALIMEKPQQGFEEQIFFHTPAVQDDGQSRAGIYNPDIDAGVVFSFDKNELPCVTEWKMMGRRDYVVGIEPGNCFPSPRCQMRKDGVLTTIEPEETRTTNVTFTFVDNADTFHQAF